MEIWIIAVIVAGGVIFLALLALIIYRCCCRRPNRKNDKRNGTAQNGHVWQAHDKDVELADEEEPRDTLKEDGLVVDTESASTFPRRIKAEDQNPEPQQQDGLCQDTEKRYTYPRRGKPENELLIPTGKKNLSPSETALKSAVPVGVSVIACSEGQEIKNEKMKSDVQVHRAEEDIPKKQENDKDSSSDSSSSDSDDEGHQNGAQHLIKTSKETSARKHKRASSVVERKRSRSMHESLEDIPEYSKPIKRAVSNPSIIAREKMLQRDKRFESMETWRSTIIRIPEPDYPNEIPTTRPKDDEDQDNAPPSYATSDSGVECLDALSGHDDESINHCDSVPESPGIPSQTKEDTSFTSFKETTSYSEATEIKYGLSKQIMHTNDHGINGIQDNAVVMTTKDHTALIDANVVKDSPSPFAVNQQSAFFQNTADENISRNASSPYSDPKLALRSTSPTWNSVGNSTRSPIERIQPKEDQMADFRSVKLRPTSTNYDQSHSFTIMGINQGYTNVSPSSENKKEQPVSLEQQKPKNQDMASPLHSGQSIIINSTDGPKEHYIIGESKTQANVAHKNVGMTSRLNNSGADDREDFHKIHLRQTPQSIKHHIGFREDLDPQELRATQTPDDSTTSDKTAEKENENEKVIGVLDGIKRFQSQGAQIPKPAFGSHYIAKKDPNTKPVSIVPREPVTNLRPVSIVAPEPSTIDRELHQTTSSTSRNITTEVKANQKENVSVIIKKNESTRPVSVINDVVVAEDRRHIRYSTGNMNQNHISLGFKDAPSKPMVIQRLDEQETTNTASDKQDSLEKPVALVPPQSPKAKRGSLEERAAFEEERKKNWKREQIEQKLTNAHIQSQGKTQQLMQASGLAYRDCMPELFSKIKQIGEEKDETAAQ